MKVWRNDAVETVKETVVGEGRSVARCGRVVSIEIPEIVSLHFYDGFPRNGGMLHSK